MDKAVPNAAGVSTPRHALPDGPLQPAGDGSEVRVAEALVAHFGRPMVVNAHRRGRSQFLVTITLGDCNEYGNPREPELLRLLVDTLHHEVVAGLIALEVAWVDQDSHSVVALMSAPGAARLRARVGDICRTLTGTSWVLDDGTVHRIVLGAGYSRIGSEVTRQEVDEAVETALGAARRSMARRDLVCLGPQRTRKAWRGLPARLRLPVQILFTLSVSILGPYAVLRLAYSHGVDLSGYAYIGIVIALGFTALLIWAETLCALSRPRLPAMPDIPAPTATAVVAAYLPNEADTIVETLGHVLGQQYPGELQVILAYNTPVDLPVETELRALARKHPELMLLKVEDSTSKAQNVNAALGVAVGEFVGVFDADHHPAPDSFTRAWRWIADGADVVQGHCVIRNGNESYVARAVAVEFEQIYAVSHPGRARLHGFGVFGGSNGFWRTDMLHEVRMRADRLTEDIDASLRSLLRGSTIVSDPDLLSRELAPVTMAALWRQRMRWSQGWFQVSVRQLSSVVTSRTIGMRQRVGMLVLFGWREVNPWVSPMVFGVLLFVLWRDDHLSWATPIFLLTTLYTLSAGPVQLMFAWKLAAPDIRARTKWFAWYLVFAAPLYTEWKNLIARIAQLNELMGDHEWHVTPRGTMRVHKPASAPPRAETADAAEIAHCAETADRAARRADERPAEVAAPDRKSGWDPELAMRIPVLPERKAV
ncbi:glycosyltransferase [Gordonia pseudamarae]|jgi:cellulose synthase/poly-beta-1,6-N-acetylglucosamine synthase-like glycosyltransferase|uniref:Glycosyltransferase n=1 Tax=Gordonia pseudamarae TaxID=2831662 RepID=A0ABX6IKE5_9ACTN|nr:MULTISPECIES: glycosyltransferase family 2 protein [Gordonia]MBD0020595.1 glycosyltransferase [Gordonia sp. (in: high G+C Gram-positive bacteria)]QHN27450.1 glycosyltransferase [Gordonia pseudamarae]QHN36334.1 glycosyltransferase [Gordonia pseudamarae]